VASRNTSWPRAFACQQQQQQRLHVQYSRTGRAGNTGTAVTFATLVTAMPDQDRYAAFLEKGFLLNLTPCRSQPENLLGFGRQIRQEAPAVALQQKTPRPDTSTLSGTNKKQPGRWWLRRQRQSILFQTPPSARPKKAALPPVKIQQEAVRLHPGPEVLQLYVFLTGRHTFPLIHETQANTITRRRGDRSPVPEGRFCPSETTQGRVWYRCKQPGHNQGWAACQRNT
jgi:superfamily II DNA/RNA helicase